MLNQRLEEIPWFWTKTPLFISVLAGDSVGNPQVFWLTNWEECHMNLTMAEH